MQTEARARESADQLASFRWEFIRRNKAYQREQEAFQARFVDWFEANGYWWDQHCPIYSEQSWYYFCREIAPAASLICERWDLTDPFPSSWQFDMAMMRKERGTKLFVPTLSSGQGRRWDLIAVDPALYPEAGARFLKAVEDIPDVICEPSWIKTGDPRNVRIEIDLAEPMQQILAEVQEYLEQKKTFYRDKIGPLPDHHRNPRNRLKEYAAYLNVWELRNQRKTFEVIATKLFPREMEATVSRSSVLKRVRMHYKRARELIDREGTDK